jgi:tetratricopeptide (TPR) repeat protein
MAWMPKLHETLRSLPDLLRKVWQREHSLPTFLSRTAGIAGFAAVFASAFTSWFSVPVAASLEAPILAEAPLVSWAYRAAGLGVSVAALLVLIRGCRWRSSLGRLYLSWLVALLFFPYFVSVWSAGAAGRASWLQSQHANLTAVSGDSFTSQEFKGSLLRHRVDVVNQPMETQVFGLPDWDSQSFGWSRMLEMAEWFGLSDWFASFLRKGWPLAIGGALVVLLALSREAGPHTLPTARRLLLRGGALFLVFFIAALAPVLIGRSFLLAAKRHAQRGDYAAARRLMRWGARCVPVITQDGEYLIQAGLLADALGLQDPEAAYYRASLAEDAGYHFQARTMYLDGLATDRSQPALLRENVKGVLRHATNAMNAGELDSAAVLLTQALAADPANLKANYSLQLIYLRSGNIDGLRALNQRMAKVYAFFNTPVKLPVLADSIQNQAVGELLQGDAAAALTDWMRAKKP